MRMEKIEKALVRVDEGSGIMNKNLYHFSWEDDYGVVEGLFIEEEDVINNTIGKKVFFGEVLGKHSEIYGELENEDFEVLTSDEKVIECLERCNVVPFGYNPLEYILEE